MNTKRHTHWLLGLSVLLSAGCDQTSAGSAGGDPTLAEDTAGGAGAPVAWTGRLYPGQDLAWASHRDLSSSAFGELFSMYQDRGWIIIDVDARPEGSGALYSMVWHENPDGRGWAQHRNLTSEEYASYWEMYASIGWRPLDVEAYPLDGQTRFAGIWIENVEGLRWSSLRNASSDEYAVHFDQMIRDGFIPIDVEGYTDGGALRFAGIFVDNVDARAIAQYRNMDRSTYQQRVDELAAEGYQVIDYESYEHGGVQYYAAVWEQPLQARAHAVATDRDGTSYTNTWRERLDAGYRLVDQELYGDQYGGVWVGNDIRHDHPQKAALDEMVEGYYDAVFPDQIGAISVAVYHDGELVYVRGVGEPATGAGLVAHGSTVYRLASVSKAIGGTLAALLESNSQLRDGSPYHLDLRDFAMEYLPDLPRHNTQTVEQLASHLGCVMHYPDANTPGITNQTVHYETALDAAASIWWSSLASLWDADQKQLNGCIIGEDWVYSTPAFTYLGAVLEAATERPITQLLDEELFEPHGLDSMRVQWSERTLPDNPLRATSYERDGSIYTEVDNSWKVLGGGIESNVVDLARFGQLLLDGEVVSADVRDERMWVPVDTDCARASGEGTCTNGLGWVLFGGNSTTRRFAEHGGSWSGARSHLRVYPDDGLVVAVLSNRTGRIDENGKSYGHNPDYIADRAESILLDW